MPPPAYLFKIRFNITLIYTPRSDGHFPSGFPTKTMDASLFYHKRATCPVNLIPLDSIARIIIGEEYRSRSSSLCSLLHSTVTSSFAGPCMFLIALLLNILKLRSSLNVRDQVSHPCKKTSKFGFVSVF